MKKLSYMPMTLATAALSACANAAPSDELVISLTSRGAVTRILELRHVADATHNCTVVDRPWKHVQHGGEMLEVPPAPPLLEIGFAMQAPPAEPAFRASAFDYHLGMATHAGTADDHVEVNLDGVRWLGSGPKLNFEFSADGLSGKVVAELAPEGAGDPARRIELEAAWTCPRLEQRSD